MIETKLHQDTQKVKDLLPGQSCVINWFEEGGAEVHRREDTLSLYEIPQYGGEEHFYGEFDFTDEGVKELVSLAYSWT